MSLPSNRPILNVDLSALVRNAEALKRMSFSGQIAACVKANAYGLGAQKVSETLARQADVQTFFVAYADEAVHILANGDAMRDAKVFVLNGPFIEDRPAYKDPRICPVVNSLHQASVWKDMGDGACAIGIDIGMNRLGTDILGAASIFHVLGGDNIIHAVMHLSHSGDGQAAENQAQLEKFEAVRRKLLALAPNIGFSLSASGGLMLDQKIEETFARPGAALYGLSASDDPRDALECVATLTAPVIMVRKAEVGEGVGYNGLWTAQRSTSVAILALGYADGFQRHLANAGSVVIGGQKCPVIGAVSMDLIAVDVTDVEHFVEPGERAEIFGPQLSVDEQAKAAGTIGYELLSTVGDRVKRLYAF